MLFALDIDECTADNGGCSVDASCSNTVGSFTCICHNGFTGDGFTCTGESAEEYARIILRFVSLFLFITTLFKSLY